MAASPVRASWEKVEYSTDAVTQGRNKALIVIGHVTSEQAGMEECTRWMKGFLKKVPIVCGCEGTALDSECEKVKV